MILVDANLLIYAHVSSFEQHAPAVSWLDAQLNGGGRVGLPWPSLLGFLRIVTNPRVFERPEPMARAWRQVQAWLEPDAVWIPQPTERHPDLLGSLVNAAKQLWYGYGGAWGEVGETRAPGPEHAAINTGPLGPPWKDCYPVGDGCESGPPPYVKWRLPGH